ncbi:hypothetical protein NP590_11560 [Methylomonas sp. SURF-2]|uniref:Uncharacterized protein n=1 Tax=Methylomonas subterranea TaxID=2952225 RepID=A0ABT1TH04_9GAMM|nr:hypothetical protein [Methylomonas sp. SURF-2]MCQ8104744.1 hypothetical protein [Methylomonas sp. SURF-2]
MNAAQVQQWLLLHPLSPIHVDCATAVMLKILDGKCKMPTAEKQVMALLYDAVKTQAGEVLAAELHGLIAEALINPDDGLKNRIYEQRLLAETTLSRPVMKGFKAMIRREGLLDGVNETEET